MNSSKEKFLEDRVLLLEATIDDLLMYLTENSNTPSGYVNFNKMLTTAKRKRDLVRKEYLQELNYVPPKENK